MEEMENNFARRLMLTEDEKDEIVIEEDEDNIIPWEEEMERSLIGTLLTNKNYKSDYMKNTMVEAWRIEGKIEIKDIAKNLYMFIFERRSDKESVINRAPWNFDRALLMLKNPERDKNPKETVFNTIEFWIQIHNLPLRAFQKNVAIKVGERIGRLIKVDESEKGLKWSTFMRVRVEVDITKPLQRGAMISLKGTGKIWADFKYERLPRVCQWCGILGHNEMLCREKIEGGKGEYGDLYAEKEFLRSKVYETKKQNSYSSSSNQYKGSEEKSGENEGVFRGAINKAREKTMTEEESDLRSRDEYEESDIVMPKNKKAIGERENNRKDDLTNTASSPMKKENNKQIEVNHAIRNLVAALGERRGEDSRGGGKNLPVGKVNEKRKKWKLLARQKKATEGKNVIMGKRALDPMIIDEDGEEIQNKKARVEKVGKDNENAIVHVTGGNDCPRYEK